MKTIPLSSSEYVLIHNWMYKNYGQPMICENDPSHEHKYFDWANISGDYKKDRSDWKRLCRACHRLFDRPSHCKNGHEFTEDNIYWYTRKRITAKSPERGCRTCRYEAVRRQYAKNKELKNE